MEDGNTENMDRLLSFLQYYYQILSTNNSTKSRFILKSTILVLYYMSTIVFLIKGIQVNKTDTDFLFDAIFDLVVLTLLASIVFIIIIFKNNNVLEIIDTMSHDLFTYATPFSKEQLRIKSKAVRKAKYLAYLLLNTIIFTGVLTKILPSLYLLLLKFNGEYDPEETIRLPLRCWMPFSIISTFRYMVAYLFTAVIYSFSCITFLVIALTFCVSIIYTCKELQILREFLAELDERSKDLRTEVSMFCQDGCVDVSTFTLDMYLHICLQEAICHYNKVLKFVERVNDTFGVILFMTAQIDCIILSISVYRLSDIPIDYQFVYYVGSSFATLYSYGIISWIGQSLIDEDCRFRQALYSCNWIDKSLSFKKTVTIMMEKAKRPMRIQIGKIYVLNFNTFTNIVKAAYSYFNLIRTVRFNKINA